MTTIYKLNGVHTANTNLPTIGDYGQLDNADLTALIKCSDASLLNEGESGGALAYVGTGTGANALSVSGGIAACPDASGASEYHYFNMPGYLSGLEFTVAMIVKAGRLTNPKSMYLFRNSGAASVNLYYNPNTAGLSALWNNGTTRTVGLLPSWAADEWSVVVLSVRSDRIVGMHNGGQPYTALFSAYGGPPLFNAAGRTKTIGLGSVNESFVGQMAGVFLYDRALDDDQMLVLSRALRRFAETKGIVV